MEHRMAERWKQLETVLAEDVPEGYPKLAARLIRLLGSCSGFDSVQFWRDLDAKADLPFVLFSERQLAALIKKVCTAPCPWSYERRPRWLGTRVHQGCPSSSCE